MCVAGVLDLAVQRDAIFPRLRSLNLGLGISLEFGAWDLVLPLLLHSLKFRPNPVVLRGDRE